MGTKKIVPTISTKNRGIWGETVMQDSYNNSLSTGASHCRRMHSIDTDTWQPWSHQPMIAVGDIVWGPCNRCYFLILSVSRLSSAALQCRRAGSLEIWDAIGYTSFLIKDTTVSMRNPVRAYSNKVDETDLSSLWHHVTNQKEVWEIAVCRILSGEASSKIRM